MQGLLLIDYNIQTRDLTKRRTNVELTALLVLLLLSKS